MGWDTSAVSVENQPVYQEGFDLAGGGASLTRASQEGVLFANPAVMPWGSKFHRWVGMETSLIFNTDERAQKTAEGLGQGESLDLPAMINQASNTPIHIGVMTSLSWITNNVGVSVFGRVEPDLELKTYGDSGTPVVQTDLEAYAGAIAGYAGKVTDWLSLGVAVKCLAIDANERIPIELIEIQSGDTSKIDEAEKEITESASGGCSETSGDVGSLFFWRNQFVDFRLALKGDNFGSQTREVTYHGGLGLTFHGRREAVHLSVDYRDVGKALGQKSFHQWYAGAKVLIGNFVGLAVGRYQGFLSMGVRLDLFLMQVGITKYSKEFGSYIGEKKRDIVMVYIATGW